MIQHYLGRRVPPHIYNYSHTLAVRVVVDICNAVYALILYKVRYALDKLGLINLIGYLRHDYLGAPGLFLLLYLRPGAHHYLAAPSGVGRPDAAAAHDYTAGGEVRAFDMLHQIIEGGIRVVYHAADPVQHLVYVVGRHICCHTHGYAHGAVYQKVWKMAGQYGGLL